MLDEMTPQQFDERWQADSLDPIDESWQQTGVLCAAIVNKITELACGLGGKSMEPHQLRKPEDYVPRVRYEDDPPPRPAGASLAEMEARHKAMDRSRRAAP